MAHNCAGEDCQMTIDDQRTFCTECLKREHSIQQTVTANLAVLDKQLRGYARFAAWLRQHPEYEEDK